MSSKPSLIRTIYLYLVSLVAIMMIVVAGVDLIDMGLKTWVFTKADQAEDFRDFPSKPFLVDERGPVDELIACDETCKLTEEQRKALDRWVVEFEAYQVDQKIDRTSARRQRDAAQDVSLLLIALPLFYFHWRIVRKEKTA